MHLFHGDMMIEVLMSAICIDTCVDTCIDVVVSTLPADVTARLSRTRAILEEAFRANLKSAGIARQGASL